MKYLLSLALALIVVSATQAQTIYTLPYITNVDFIDYGTYANLFDSDMTVVIDGQAYLVSINAHFDTNYTIDQNVAHNIQFWNQSVPCRGVYTSPCVEDIPVTGSITGFTYVLNQVGPTIVGSFTGVRTGSFVINLLPHHPCATQSRYCKNVFWAQTNSTLTLD